MGAVRKRVGRITPGATGVRARRSKQRSAIEYIHLAIGLCGASQHHMIRIDNGVAHDDGSIGRGPIDGHTQRTRSHASIAGHIGCRRRQTVRAIRQRRRRISPRSAAIG